jgi:Fe-S-cluster containining protein
MPHADSIDKIVSVYLAAVCKKAFRYKGLSYHPKPLVVSPLIFRGFSCPVQCGGCCPRFSLDYLPYEKKPYALEAREVEVNGRTLSVMSDLQKDHRDHFCRNLDRATGRCTIHGRHPFSCDFELIRFIRYEERVIQTQKLFNRGWAMIRVDGGRGARCEMLPATSETMSEVLRKLRRLKEWADFFGINTHLPTIIDWVPRGPHADALRL